MITRYTLSPNASVHPTGRPRHQAGGTERVEGFGASVPQPKQTGTDLWIGDIA